MNEFPFNADRIIELMKIELACVSRDECDRDCGNCDLVQDRGELIDMYKKVIGILTDDFTSCSKEQMRMSHTIIPADPEGGADG